MNEEESPNLALWERLDAFRELLSDGGSLLGEVTTLVQNAELSMAALAERQQAVEELKSELDDCRKQRDDAFRELESLRGERRRAGVRKFGDDGSSSELERRLLVAERELQELRQTLAQERERRNRAISLIRPAAAPQEEPQKQEA